MASVIALYGAVVLATGAVAAVGRPMPGAASLKGPLRVSAKQLPMPKLSTKLPLPCPSGLERAFASGSRELHGEISPQPVALLR